MRWDSATRAKEAARRRSSAALPTWTYEDVLRRERERAAEREKRIADGTWMEWKSTGTSTRYFRGGRITVLQLRRGRARGMWTGIASFDDAPPHTKTFPIACFKRESEAIEAANRWIERLLTPSVRSA